MEIPIYPFELKDQKPMYRKGFLVIPEEILNLVINEQLLPQEAFLLGYIHCLDGELGCYASNKYLGEMMGGMKDSSIRGIISKFIKLGLVRTESFNGRTRILRSNLKTVKQVDDQYFQIK